MLLPAVQKTEAVIVSEDCKHMNTTSCTRQCINLSGTLQIRTFEFSIRKKCPEIVGHLIFNEATLKLANQQTILASNQMLLGSAVQTSLYHHL